MHSSNDRSEDAALEECLYYDDSSEVPWDVLKSEPCSIGVSSLTHPQKILSTAIQHLFQIR